MKKLICSFVFAMGFVMSVQAQFTAQGGNNSVDPFYVKAGDSNGNQHLFLNINPGSVFGATTPDLKQSTTPVYFQADNLTNGCSTGVIQATPSGTAPMINCLTGSVSYTVVQNGNAVVLTLSIND